MHLEIENRVIPFMLQEIIVFIKANMNNVLNNSIQKTTYFVAVLFVFRGSNILAIKLASCENRLLEGK